MVYGDSYGDVANRELAMDQARDSRYFQSLAANRAAEQIEMQARQAEAANRLAAVQAAMNQRRYLEEMAQRREQAAFSNNYNLMNALQRQREFQSELNYRRNMDQESQRRWNEELALKRSQLQDQQGNADYREASDAIMRGLVRPDAIPNLYPKLNPTQQSRLGDYYNTLAQQEAEQIKSGETLAKTVQAMINAERQSAGIAGLGMVPKLGLFGNGQGAIDEYNKNVEAIKANPPLLPPDKYQAFLASLGKRGIPLNNLSINEENQSFGPAPVPRLYNRAGTQPSVPFTGNALETFGVLQQNMNAAPQVEAPVKESTKPADAPAPKAETAKKPETPVAGWYRPMTEAEVMKTKGNPVGRYKSIPDAVADGNQVGDPILLYKPETQKYVYAVLTDKTTLPLIRSERPAEQRKVRSKENYDIELREASMAIMAGAPEDKVRERFFKATGRVLP